MPKASISWLLLLLMIISVSAKTLLFVDYELREEYYARNFCIKKDIPGNCCKGSCHLSKELKTQEERETRSFPAPAFKLEVVFIQEESIRIGHVQSERPCFHSKGTGQLCAGIFSGLLRPPGC